MGRSCTICNHPQREAIDEALVAGQSFRDIAKRHGTPLATLFRHKQHLSQTLIQSARAAEVAHGDRLLDRVEELQNKTLTILREAERRGDHALALRAIGEARRNLELLAELTHELNRSPQVNLLLSPDWLRLRGVILGALQAFPEARQSVAAALLEVEDEPGA